MRHIQKIYNPQVRIFVGILLIACAGLVSSYQNFDNVRARTPASVSSDTDSEDMMADENIRLTGKHILPSLVETIAAIEDFQLKGVVSQDIIKSKKEEAELESMAAIALPLSQMQSMGIASGQRLEVEVNGASVPVYAFSESDLSAGINMSHSAAKNLGAKVGDRIIVRQLSESPPKVTDK